MDIVYRVRSSVDVSFWVYGLLCDILSPMHASVQLHKNTALGSHQSDHDSPVHNTAPLKQNLSKSKQENTKSE